MLLQDDSAHDAAPDEADETDNDASHDDGGDVQLQDDSDNDAAPHGSDMTEVMMRRMILIMMHLMMHDECLRHAV